MKETYTLYITNEYGTSIQNFRSYESAEVTANAMRRENAEIKCVITVRYK